MTSSIVVYHGTDCLFDKINLAKSRDKRDFGKGFYTTTISTQAESWATNMMMRRGTDHAYVYEYELSLTESLSILSFDGLTVDWLNFVKDNRTQGGIQHNFDLVMGPVANDNTLLTVMRYIQGVYHADEALRRLRYFKANDQVSLHTEKALANLSLLRRYEVD